MVASGARRSAAMMIGNYFIYFNYFNIYLVIIILIISHCNIFCNKLVWDTCFTVGWCARVGLCFNLRRLSLTLSCYCLDWERWTDVWVPLEEKSDSLKSSWSLASLIDDSCEGREAIIGSYREARSTVYWCFSASTYACVLLVHLMLWEFLGYHVKNLVIAFVFHHPCICPSLSF